MSDASSKGRRKTEDVFSEIIDLKQAFSQANSDDRRAELSDAAFERTMALVRQIDETGLLSEHLRNAASHGGKEAVVSRYRVELIAHLLGSIFGHEVFSDNDINAGAGHTFAFSVDQLNGAKLTELVPPSKRGDGNRPKTSLQRGAGHLICQIVHYRSGKDKVSLETAFAEIVPGRSFESFQRIQNTWASRDDRSLAKNIGVLVRENRPLSPSRKNLQSRIEHFLEDTMKLNELADAAYRKDGK